MNTDITEDDFKIFSRKSPSVLGKLETQYHAPYTAWQQNNAPETRSALLQMVQPVIDRGVKTYGNNEPVARSYAKKIVLESLPRYNPNDSKLDTFILSQLQGLQRYVGQQRQIVKIPERIVIDHGRLQTAEAELADKLGRDPSTTELQKHTGLSQKRIETLRKYSPGVSTTSVERPGDDEGGGGDIASQLPGEPASHAAWLSFVYDDLTPRDQMIMESLLGMNGKRRVNVTQLAKRMNVSPATISTRAKYIQSLIDQRERVLGY